MCLLRFLCNVNHRAIFKISNLIPPEDKVELVTYDTEYYGKKLPTCFKNVLMSEDQGSMFLHNFTHIRL
jgi:hypothetical protein